MFQKFYSVLIVLCVQVIIIIERKCFNFFLLVDISFDSWHFGWHCLIRLVIGPRKAVQSICPINRSTGHCRVNCPLLVILGNTKCPLDSCQYRNQVSTRRPVDGDSPQCRNTYYCFIVVCGVQSFFLIWYDFLTQLVIST